MYVYSTHNLVIDTCTSILYIHARTCDSLLSARRWYPCIYVHMYECKSHICMYVYHVCKCIIYIPVCILFIIILFPICVCSRYTYSSLLLTHGSRLRACIYIIYTYMNNKHVCMCSP